MRKQRNPVRSLSLIALGGTGVISAVTRMDGTGLSLTVRQIFGVLDMVGLPALVISTVLRLKCVPEGGYDEKGA